MLVLGNNTDACEKFVHKGGPKVMLETMVESSDRKGCLDVLQTMLKGAKSSVRTELVMVLEEIGIIPQARCKLHTPVPVLSYSEESATSNPNSNGGLASVPKL